MGTWIIEAHIIKDYTGHKNVTFPILFYNPDLFELQDTLRTTVFETFLHFININSIYSS